MQLRRRRQERSGRCAAPRASPPRTGPRGHGTGSHGRRELSSLEQRAEGVKTRRTCIRVISPDLFPTMSDEEIGTTLAYTKSPKVSRRTTFQNELQEAISARAARQQTAEYSDDFDSDEDEELPENNSAVENTNKKSVAFNITLSDDETTQKKALLKSEIADDLTSLLHEEKLQQMTILKSQNLSGDREDETECLFIEKLTCRDNEGDHCNESHMAILQNEREEITQHEFENKPVPKLREQRIKNISSAENVSISALDDHYKPSPQPRSVLRKSSHVEDKDVARAEDKASSSYRLSSFSAPSSLTRLSDIITTSEKRTLAESPSPEGPWLTSSPAPFPIHFHSADEISADSSLLMCGEGSPSKGQDQTEDNDCRDLKLENNGRKSPSVIELMMTTVYEKTKKLQKSSDYQLEENLRTLEEKFIANGIKEVSLNNKSEDMAEVSTSEDSDKKEFEYKETLSQKVRPSSSSRSLSSTYLKKAGKTIPPSTTTSSQYLGTLRVLDNKHLQKYSAELDKADSLRAAVYQDWLEKKRVFLLELQRIKRNKAENLKNANEKKEATKKEEAIASFEAWKAMKEKEAKKKLADKRKLEELKKRRAAEQNEEKKEEAQKAFEKWKEKKAEYLREQSRKEKRAERIKKKKEEEAIAEKKRDSMSAVDKWNEKKEEFVKQKKTEKIQEKRQQEIEQVEREEKDKRAMEEYERWLEEPPLKGQLSTAQNQQRLEAAPAAKEKKERRDQIEKKQKKLQVILEDENPPPWSPPGKAVSSRNY
ncbi:microtubule-associated protein 9 isoform X2 [Gopherus evgoodei]|uniref:microtubule-associated protein 9 isoform X2 n=1 Tax=Gopherus evgoodei TaxID=1825980 RepID=UPI0011CFE729|nr:microtubule-associated protein 9 isoform X2 [Gopherus evgoodei]